MLPNILTIGRILLTPLFILCLFYEAPWSKVSALGIFIFASVTDAFDGHIARKRNLVTKTGEFLDPLADKILVVSAFLSFALLDKIPFWMVGLIVFRDLFVTGTGAQITAIIFVLIYLSLKTLSFVDASQLIVFIDSFNLIWIIVFSATIFTVYTGLHYLYINRASIEAFIEHSSDGA